MAHAGHLLRPELTVSETLNRLNVEHLKDRIRLLPVAEIPTRKAHLVAAVEPCLSGAVLRDLWNRLDETQQLAVRETVYNGNGRFDADAFRAKYGGLPDTTYRSGRRGPPSPLHLFLYPENRYENRPAFIPRDLAERLRAFIPRPPDATLPAMDELPEADEAETGGAPLVRRDMERAAPQDLLAVLHLIDGGKVAVSAKTRQASASAVRGIAGVLAGGDFFDPITPKGAPADQAVGPIKAFAWPWLVQAAGLAKPHGARLALTKSGRTALGAPPAETLRKLWQRWRRTTLFDEFRRIDAIKGQQRGRGRSVMTAAPGRRDVINNALAQCSVNRWVHFDDFSRFMHAAGLTFEVTHDPWALYLVDPNYGSLGYDGGRGWHILQERYLLCLLFEYAAALGLIDVAYREPGGARNDYTHQRGADYLAFLSRYDGLRYFRLTPLGAWCLELTDTWQPSLPATRAALHVLPDLLVLVEGAPLSADERLSLETWTVAESEDTWRLDGDRTLAAIESGRNPDDLRMFLTARDEQPLPERVEGFLQDNERRARALMPRGMALLVECVDAELAARLAGHKRIARLCHRAGDRYLAVPAGSEDAFRKAVRTLGYGMPKQ